MTAEHERALWMRWRFDVRANVPWRTHGPFVQLILFVVTLLAVVFLAILLDERLHVAHAGIINGVAAIIVAEVLIRVRRWFFTGVESALWCGGLFAAVLELGRGESAAGLLAFALASVIAGWRTRNPFLGGAAAAFVVAYFETRDLGVLAALVIGAAAMVAMLRTWRRPSTEWLWIVLAVGMPAFGRFEADAQWVRMTIVLYACYALIALVLAIAKRRHAYFAAGGVALAIACVDFARTFHLFLPLEAKLALGGAILLGGSWWTARALRDRTTGIVTTPLEDDALAEAIELAATAGIPQASFQPAREGGGQFGGAGATGKY